jgi:polar amino acid transport system substrate-binding protein
VAQAGYPDLISRKPYDNGRRFRSAARKGDARAPQDTSPSEALASKQVHMAMYRWPIFAAMVVVGGTATAENISSARKELTPTGKLRVGVLVSSLGPSTFYAAQNATTERLEGVTVGLAGALARELGVPLELVPYPSAEALNHSATTGAWDVTFMTVDRHRETLVAFGPAYAVFEATYLVPSASPIRSIADVDQPGIRVSAIREGGLALRLRQSLRNASLVPAPTLEVAYEMMRRGQVDAIASQRGRLNALASRHPDTRVLGESFANGRQAIAVPKHRPAALRFVCRFMEKAKASGEVQRALDAAGLTGETVASPEPC